MILVTRSVRVRSRWHAWDNQAIDIVSYGLEDRLNVHSQEEWHLSWKMDGGRCGLESPLVLPRTSPWNCCLRGLDFG